MKKIHQHFFLPATPEFSEAIGNIYLLFYICIILQVFYRYIIKKSKTKTSNVPQQWSIELHSGVSK